MKYNRKQSTPIDAEQFLQHGCCPRGVLTEEDGRHYVMTLHNQKCYIVVGDWIVAEMDGIHYYPIKNSVFQATYEV